MIDSQIKIKYVKITNKKKDVLYMLEQRIGADDLLYLITEKNVLINTLIGTEQTLLIQSTVPIEMEEFIINNLLSCNKTQKSIIIYGKNHTDVSIYIKYKQLIKLGFRQHLLYIYTGGLYEWILLHNCDNNKYTFNCLHNEIDLQKHKPISIIPHNLISNIGKHI